MGEAWELARGNIHRAQKCQKQQHDLKAKDVNFSMGDRVFVIKPATKTGRTRKFVRPFEGPYRVIATYDNGDVCLVDKPTTDSIRVALGRLRPCPEQRPCRCNGGRGDNPEGSPQKIQPVLKDGEM